MNARTTWRLAGVLCLAGAFLLVLFSETLLTREMNPRLIMIFWGSLLCLLGAAVYIAMLDMRFNRLMYKKQERDLFLQTFMHGKLPEKKEEKAEVETSTDGAAEE